MLRGFQIQSRTYTCFREGILKGRCDAVFAVMGLAYGGIFFVGLAVWTGQNAGLVVMGPEGAHALTLLESPKKVHHKLLSSRTPEKEVGKQ
jgi:hypothetical protein